MEGKLEPKGVQFEGKDGRRIRKEEVEQKGTSEQGGGRQRGGKLNYLSRAGHNSTREVTTTTKKDPVFFQSEGTERQKEASGKTGKQTKNKGRPGKYRKRKMIKEIKRSWRNTSWGSKSRTIGNESR